MATISSLKFDNLALRSLPLDREPKNQARTVRGACFSRVSPTPVTDPRVVAYSKDSLELLGLDISEIHKPEFAEYLSGNKIIPGSEPAAHCYCGHQFGYFSGQLGDGATMYLGEVINPKGERWEIQFKGAGKTPYSRTADGRKVLRSSIREFLCSEANYYLGVPTTRAGCVVTSSSYVIRDIFYDGNPIKERCTIILRIAPTFLRFGSFEIFKERDPQTGREGPSHGFEGVLLPQMLDYVVKTFYPEIDFTSPQKYEIFYREIVLRTARLVAEWQTSGFCHGVLNTDNMSIIGVTLDYGPFGFMESFDPDYVCNGSDSGGRYTYKKQPEICHWNCQKLAEALQPVLPEEISSKILQENFYPEFEKHYNNKLSKKFGLIKKRLESDKKLFADFFQVLSETGGDFTNCFRSLSKIPIPTSEFTENDCLPNELQELLLYLINQGTSVENLLKKIEPKIPADQLQKLQLMAEKNPAYLQFFGLDTDLLNREVTKLEKKKLLKTLTQQQLQRRYQGLWSQWISQYLVRLRKEVEDLSNDEETIQKINQERVQVMNSNNPSFILRNYVAQDAIQEAEKGNYQVVQDLLEILKNPYKELAPDGRFIGPPPVWAHNICVT